MITKQESKRLYHSAIFTPRAYHSIDDKQVYLTLSEHAKRECQKDKNGLIYPASSIKFSYSDIIEIESYKESKDVKIVIRQKYNKQNDIIYVIIFKHADVRIDAVNLPPSALVKTVWLNAIDDNHATLDASKYYNPETSATIAQILPTPATPTNQTNLVQIGATK